MPLAANPRHSRFDKTSPKLRLLRLTYDTTKSAKYMDANRPSVV